MGAASPTLSPFVGRDGACLPLDHVVCCSSASGAVVEFVHSGVLCWSPVRLTLRQMESSRSSSTRSRWLSSGFLSPTAGRSFIGGTSACSRASAGDRYLSSLRAGDCGLPLRRWVHARVLMAACLPLLRVWWTAPSHITLMLCASTGIFFSGQSWPLPEFPLCGFSAGLCKSSLALPSRCLSESAPALHRLIFPHCGFV